MQEYEEPQATESDPPIIVQGGGSVDVKVPDSFTQQLGQGSGKNFKNDKVYLVSLQIDENTPIVLDKNSKITITYK